jgi:hypothetical protein
MFMRFPFWILIAVFGVCLVGCDSNPTNAPSEDAIKKANADRAAAIDNDPNLSPDQKQKMKEMMKLSPGSSDLPGSDRKGTR